MGIIFCIHGGAGSASLITKMRELTGRLVHCRPDIAFYTHDTPPLTTSWREGGQILSERSYDDLPTPEAAALFESRATGYRLDLTRTIADNLDAYLQHMADSDDAVLLCRAPCLGFLTAHRDSAWHANVIAMVREPLAQFTSFMKPERHEDWSHAFGGVCTPGAVDQFARGWTSFTRDCVDAGVRLICFDHAREAVQGDHLLEQLFDDWVGTRRSRSPLTPELESRLHNATGDLWSRARERADACRLTSTS